jgi:hypothetical protein
MAASHLNFEQQLLYQVRELLPRFAEHYHALKALP